MRNQYVRKVRINRFYYISRKIERKDKKSKILQVEEDD